MTLAHDTATRFPVTNGTTGINSVDTTTGNRTFSHSGSASAAGAVVVVCCTGTTAVVTGVLYGGVAMGLQSTAADTSEAGRIDIYVLAGETTPTGTQTVTLQGCTATAKWATCSTLTASAGTAVFHVANKVDTTTAANPSVALTTTTTTLAYGACHTGTLAPPTVVTAGCTLQHQNDYGALAASTLRRTSPDAAGTVTLGFTLASDDYCIAGAAFHEQVIQTATATVTATASIAATGVDFPTRPPGPLTDVDIVQVGSGMFSTASASQFFDVTLPNPATYGNSIIVGIGLYRTSGGSILVPVGFVQDSPGSAAPIRMYVFRRAAVGEGETTWQHRTGTAPSFVEWVVMEVAGLDPTSAVDAVSTMTQTSGTVISPSLPAGLSYDNLQLLVCFARNTVDTTVPTWNGYTPVGFTELADHGDVDGAQAFSVAVARCLPASPIAVAASATASMTGPLAAVAVSYTAVDARIMTDVSAFWGFEWGTVAGMTLGTSPIFTAVTGTPAITTSTPRTGTYCLELTATAGVCSVTQSAPFAASLIGGVRIPLYFVGSLPAGDVNLLSIEITSSASLYIRFRAASSKLEVQIETTGINGVARLSSAVVTANTWLAVEVQYDVRVGGYFLGDWAVDYGDGTLVAQTQATFVQANAPASVTTLRLGWNVNATATIRTDDVVIVRDAGNYPINDHTVQPLLVDSVETLTTTDDAKFQTFTANGTLVAWDATVARGAIDEIPPTIGASADGLAQITAGASDYISIPMSTYAGGAEAIRAARMLWAGWAASGTAATLGFRAFDGTTEMLLAAAADVGFDNSTTLPAWVALPIRPAAGSYTWTQTKLNALELRVGFGDAAVAVGGHGVVCEVLIQTSAPTSTFGEAGSVSATAGLDPSFGETNVEVVTPPEQGTTLKWIHGGVESSQTIPAGADQSVVLDPDVTNITIESEPS